MRTFIILYFMLITQIALSQQTSPRAVVSNDQLNILYYDIENSISVAVDGYDADKIIVTAGPWCILKGDSGHYSIYRKYDKGKVRIVKINIFTLNQDEDTLHICEKQYELKRIPKPTIYLGTASGDGYPGFRNVNFISARLEDFPIDIQFRVTSFKMIYEPKGKDQIQFETTGTALTSEMKTVLKKAKAGDKITITDVKVLGYIDNLDIPENRNLRDINITID